MEIIKLKLRNYNGLYPANKTPENLRTPTEVTIESHEKESGKKLGGGTNQTLYIKLKNDGSVVFKPKDGEAEMLAHLEQYKRERAAYLVDRFMGLNLIPATVIREIDGKIGSAQEFIPDTITGSEYGS